MTTFKSLLIRTLAMSFTSFLLMAGSLANAEKIKVPLGQQGDAANAIERPSAGMTKTQVQKRFGEPTGFKDAVGKPPISSWSYNNFTVYFEYDRVIHSVLDHRAI
jgi:hypothetical protein